MLCKADGIWATNFATFKTRSGKGRITAVAPTANMAVPKYDTEASFILQILWV